MLSEITSFFYDFSYQPDIRKDENSYYDGNYLSSWLSEAAAQCGVTLEQAIVETAELADIYGEDVVPDIVVSYLLSIQ